MRKKRSTLNAQRSISSPETVSALNIGMPDKFFTKAFTGEEFTALSFDFKMHAAEYLATISHTNMRTLAEPHATIQSSAANAR
jgi:hypothetical protein